MSKTTKLKTIPKFKNEDEERDFWANQDTTEYFDWSKAVVNPVFPNLKFSTRTITLRLTESMYNQIKGVANKRDVPYQSYMKMVLADHLKRELAR
jgi:predicted DNA binding CopG/RHH family protein